MTYIANRKLCLIAIIGFVVLASSAARSDAQGFVSPFVGYDFGGDSGCTTATNCEDKKLNAGVSVGALGNVFGFEEEIAYASNFFGKTTGNSSSVLTAMSNLVIAPKIGAVRPYVVGGIGLMKTNIDFTAASIISSDHNSAAWDLGAGVMGFVGEHVGIRAEIRHFRAFDDFSVLGVNIDNTKLRYSRASAGVIFKF